MAAPGGPARLPLAAAGQVAAPGGAQLGNGHVTGSPVQPVLAPAGLSPADVKLVEGKAPPEGVQAFNAVHK